MIECILFVYDVIESRECEIGEHSGNLFWHSLSIPQLQPVESCCYAPFFWADTRKVKRIGIKLDFIGMQIDNYRALLLNVFYSPLGHCIRKMSDVTAAGNR